ncbi:MAG: hypothetical protein RIG62_09845 [Cyclobacteriaceae bacterium]
MKAINENEKMLKYLTDTGVDTEVETAFDATIYDLASINFLKT